MSYPIYSVPAGDVLPVFFATYAGATGASITLTGLIAGDIEIYKDGGTTQRASDAGYTLLDTDGIDFDGVTGIHGFSIDTGDNTDAGFYTVGAWFHVVVSAITVDSQTVNFIAAAFRLMAAEAVAAKPKVDVDAWLGTAAATPSVAGVPEVDVTHMAGSTTDVSTIPASVAAILVDTAEIGAAGAGLTNINLPNQTMDITGNITGNLSGSVGSVTGAVGSVTGAVGSVTGNVGGNVTGSVGSVAAGGITASSVATGAIDADALAADAVAEIADGVWDEALSGHTTAGTAGQRIQPIRTGTAQAGAAGTITLDASASAVDDFYNGNLVHLTAGTGALQSRVISDYVGSTKVASVSINWATNPSSDSVFQILPGGASTITGTVDANVVSMAADTMTAAAAAADLITELQSGLATASALATVDSLVDTLIAAVVTLAVKTGAVTTDAGNSATAFETNLSETANDHWKDAFLVITSGVLVGQVKKVTAYNGTTKIITVSGGFTATPADAVTFALVNR